jgi:putative DNA primase/helicase
MSLRGKRIVWASESDEGRPLDISRLKWLSGGDTLVGRNVFGKKPVEFKPTHTPFLLTNNKPRITPDDYAVWDRIHLIPFNYKFVNDPKAPDERKRNPNLKRELMSESSGILAWLVKGAVEYFQHGLNPPNIVLEATKEYRENEDIVGQFIKDCCLPSTEDRVQAGALYDSYKRWCEANGYEALGTVKFSKRISKDFQKVKKGVVYYIGIKLQTS